MLKRAALALLLAIPALAADFRARFTGSMLDVYVAESINAPADIPGAPAVDNRLIVSVKTTDDLAHAVSVWVMVRLDDGTRTTRRAIMERTGDERLVFTFSLGERRPVEVVSIHVDNLRKSFSDTMVRSY